MFFLLFSGVGFGRYFFVCLDFFKMFNHLISIDFEITC